MTTAVQSPLEELEGNRNRWLLAMFRRYFTVNNELIGFAERHLEFWRWVWSIERGDKGGIVEALREVENEGGKREYRMVEDLYAAFVGIWPRGGGKSTSVELAVAALGAMGRRKYVLYVSGKADKANDHVQNIAEALQSSSMEAFYPEAAKRKLTMYGLSRAWRRNRIWTDSGFIVDALGLDTDVRGAKLDENRPDLIILDDIDDEHDSAQVTHGKIETITKAIIPAGSNDCVYIAIQNLISKDSVFDQLAGEADWLSNRYVSGPHPAVLGMATEQVGPRKHKIIAGVPSWKGQDIERCEKMIDDMGLRAFKTECQHDLGDVGDRVLPLFSAQVHKWVGSRYPDFYWTIGGLDAGGEGETAHWSAGLLAGLFRFPDDDEDVDRLMIVGAFKERGSGIAIRQRTWMRAQELLWGGEKADWRMDGSERVGVQLLRSDEQFDFNIIASKKGKGVLNEQTKEISKYLDVDQRGRPFIYYHESVTDPVEIDLLGWKRKPPNAMGEGKRDPYDSDIGACMRYLIEQFKVSKGNQWQLGENGYMLPRAEVAM